MMQAAEEMMAAPPPPEPGLDLKEYIVTLKNKEDLESFYDDMETPGGDLYIPDRAVEVSARRTISRNTHYMLTAEEVESVRSDPRVLDVVPVEFAGFRKPNYTITGIFSWSSTNNATYLNWGLYRCRNTDWDSSWTPFRQNPSETVSIDASGKNVDVVIIDGHIDPAHPEFAVNSDGTGGSRVIQYNWFQHNAQLGLGANGNYVYTPYIDGGDADRTDDNNHGCHVAGTVAGNRQGWARDANIYNISPYVTNPNGSTAYNNVYDYVRAFHNSKPINPVTGRKNPTIVNGSFGSAIRYNSEDFGPVTRIRYRGVDFNPGRNLTFQEIVDRGMYFDNSFLDTPQPYVPYSFSGDVVDVLDMIDDGIIVVAAAGNESFWVARSDDQDYNNIFYATYLGINYFWYMHRGTPPGNTGICVGAVQSTPTEPKATFSNCGTRIDVFAPGQNIMSSLHSGGIVDNRNGSYRLFKYQGTSMASPQVCGVLACLLEVYPNMTHADALEYIEKVSIADTITDDDNGDDSVVNLTSLQGAPNRYLYYKPERPSVGTTMPKQNFRLRPITGAVYPRPRIRTKG